MMRLRTVLAAAALVCSVGSASAAIYPPGPGGAFPDTLTIVNIQDPLAVPFPAIPDTVHGIRGIVTGFDPKPTGFAFYIQDATGNPYTGLDVFTGGTNYQTFFPLAIGDDVVVYGKKQEFAGETEIEGFDNSTSTNDVIVRKISSGNPVPPFFVGTTTQLQELPTNTFAEQYEGMLVRVNGPMVVRRTSLSGGTIGQNNAFILVSASAPSDSLFIDGNTLTTFAPPAIGTTVDMVQGIYNQRARGYRIQIRDGNDIVLATPPNVVDAYPVADNQIRVTFDRNVTAATGGDENNYSLASFGSIDDATMDGSQAVILTVTNGLNDGDDETVTISGIAGLANGLVMTSPQSRTFANGVLSCAQVEAADPDSLGVDCVDKSRFAGSGGQLGQGVPGVRMSVTGVATGVYGSLFYMSDEGQPLRGAVSVFAPSTPLVPGRKYLIAGQVQEFFGETEIVNSVYIQDLGAVAAIEPRLSLVSEADNDTCDATNALIDGEDLECLLIKLPYVKVVQSVDPLPTTGFHVAGMNPAFDDTIFVSNLNGVLTPFNHPALGGVYSITGVVHYANGSFRLCPRNYADIVFHGDNVGVPPTNGGKVRFAAYPNPGVKSRLVFSLPQESDVELGVYDLSGREVAQLAKGRMPAGEYTRQWDGKAGSGVYFYRLKVNGETYSARAVRLGQ